MAQKSRIKVKEKDGVVTAKIMANHEMLSYQEAAKAKKEVNFITSMVGTSNGVVVFEMSSSQFLSKNPYIKFEFPGKAGEEFSFTWTDLKGNKQTDTETIK